jgi:hypothetical protein
MTSWSGTHWTDKNRPKISYASREAAVAGMRWAERKFGTRMAAYRCRTCNLWHYGNTDRMPIRLGVELDVELGRRVVFALKDENGRNERERRARLGRRLRGVGQRR